jgi:exonuclease VII small subunit
MMSTTSDSDVAAELEAAHDRLETLESNLELGEDDLDAVADAYESVVTVLDRWEERATDWDDFEGYVEFRNDISETLESIPEDVPESEAFLEADSHVKTSGVTGSLKTGDFDAARRALAPARDHAETRDTLSEARSRYRTAYRAAQDRRQELDEQIADLERLVRLGEADLDAPIAELRDPIERYNEAVTEAFENFRREAPAREFLSFVVRAADYPLVELRRPPTELLEYVKEQPAGDHPVPDLLEFADYSPSKLSHYVDDANRLKRRVATNRTYLEGLSADPLHVEWPPAEAESLRFRAEELVSLVDAFADEETVTALRDVRERTRREEYDRLRTAAVARSELDEDERVRVKSGTVESELEAARDERGRLEEALEAFAPE